MQDRFKCRMYDKKAKKMYSFENDCLLETTFECLKQQLAFDSKLNIFNAIAYDHIADGRIFMQCTGKKDGHNKTIFEGDLLLCFDKPDRDGWYCELLCEVIYDNQNASFSLKTIKYKPFGRGCFTSDSTTRIYNFSDVENIEVFGNKYENPELLNKGIQ